MSVVVENCRESDEPASSLVACDQTQIPPDDKKLPDIVAQEMGAEGPDEQQQQQQRRQKQEPSIEGESSLNLNANLNATTNQTSTARTAPVAIKQVPSSTVVAPTKPRWKLTSMSTSGNMNKLKAGNELQQHLQEQQQQQSANKRGGGQNFDGNNQTATMIDKSRQARLHKNYGKYSRQSKPIWWPTMSRPKWINALQKYIE